MASVFLSVAERHLEKNNQPDTLTATWTYLSRAQVGHARLLVQESKIGRGTSVLHVSLHQNKLLDVAPWISPESKAEVVAYMTNGNIAQEQGVSLPTQWALSNHPPGADLEKVKKGEDPRWVRMHGRPIMKRIPMFGHLEYYQRKEGHVLPTTQDFWVRLAHPENMTPMHLGYIADALPPLMIESYRPNSKDDPIPPGGFPINKGFWYPTLSMSLDVKKRLPPQGSEWLRLRAVSRTIVNGRYDAEVLMFDQDGELLAISNHTAMALDFERNLGQRGRPKI